MRAIGAIAILGLLAVPALADPVAAPTPDTAPGIAPAQSQGAGGYNPPKPKEGFRYPECFCTDKEGKRVEIGQTTCLSVGSQQFTARCEMVLNNPIWKRVSDGCPSV